MVAKAMEKGSKTKIKMTTPAGIAIFPHLLAEDAYQLETNNKHECNTQLRLDPSQPGVQEFIDSVEEHVAVAFEVGKVSLEAAAKEAKGKKLKDLKDAIEGLAPHTPFEPEYDDEGEETGNFICKMKTTVGGVDKKTSKPWKKEVAIFDASGSPIKGEARNGMRLWGGSTIKVSIQLIPFCAEGLKKAGISFRILAVQVINLPEGGGSAEDHGFGVEEGGYAAENFENTTAPEPASDDGADEDDDDF